VGLFTATAVTAGTELVFDYNFEVRKRATVATPAWLPRLEPTYGQNSLQHALMHCP
jgi:hypothetical protein